MTRQVKIDKLNSRDILSIDAREEQRDDVLRIGGKTELYRFGKNLLASAYRIDGIPQAWTARSEDGKVLGSFGFNMSSEHVVDLWGLIGSESKGNHISVLRFLKKKVEEIDVTRLQCFVDSDFKQANRTLEFLGFEKEATLAKIGASKQDQNVYRIIK
jgi:RimJ/RimL family protein N-acetyltransferase